MAEWLKAHAWKACIPQGIQGSNPCLSANQSAHPKHMNRLLPILFLLAVLSGERARAESGQVAPHEEQQVESPARPALQSLDDLLDKAKSQVKAGDATTAAKSLTEYLTSHPDSAEAMYLMGLVQQRRKLPKESLEWFTKAASVSPPDAEELRIVALDYVLLNDYSDALHWLELSVQKDPRNFEAWYDLGRVRMTRGDFSGAEQALGTALLLKPKLVKAEDNLGVTYEAENRPADAVKAYQAAIEWQQSDAQLSEQPLLNYGTFLNTQQRGAESLPLLQKAVSIAPNNVKCHEQLAHALEQTGSQKAAIEEMRRAIELEPKNGRLHFQLGQMYRRAGDQMRGKQEMVLSGQLYGTSASEPIQ